MPRTPVSALRRLASLYGVQTAYYDVSGRRQQADPESLVTVLRLLGASVQTADDVSAALRERQQAWWQRGVEPVLVVWDGAPLACELRLPATRDSGLVSCHLQTESGQECHWETDLTALPIRHTMDLEGTSYVSRSLPVAAALPLGYHRLVLCIADRQCATQIISAPKRAYTPPGSAMQKAWGVFLPLYALHSEHSWGGGDFADLEACMDWIAALGGKVIGTLPLLSAFLDTPYDPSPYAPASRLLWNEFYIDLSRAPGLQECPGAQKLLTSRAVRATLSTFRAASLVDYREQMALKRQVLEELSRWFFAGSSDRQSAFRSFLDTHPAVEDYARFRAVGERSQAPWTSWPEPARSGLITDADYDARRASTEL
jgi:4-alpha-glucanotransferase